MESNQRTIWYYSIQLLKLFRGLKYDKVPLGPLLLRDFQKVMKRTISTNRSPQSSFRTLSKKFANIQEHCLPYLPKSTPQLTRTGCSLMRAEMHGITKLHSVKKQRYLYVAHHRKEYERVKKKLKGKRLIYFPSIPEYRPLLVFDQSIYTHLNKRLKRNSTPNLFRQKWMKAWLRKKTSHTLRQIRKAHTLFQRYRIKETIYGSTVNRFGMLITSFAQTRRILTINIQHGLYGEAGHLPVNADLNLCWGESHKNYLIHYGAHPNKFRVIVPTFIRNLDNQSQSVRQRSTSDPSGFHNKSDLRLLVAMQPLGKRYNRMMVQRIEKAIRQLPVPVHVAYKLHPEQGSGTGLKRLLQNKHSRIYPHRTSPLQPLLQQADIVITPFSSVSIEGLLIHKPVLFYGDQKPMYFLKEQPVFMLNPTDIRKVLQEYIANPNSCSILTTHEQLKDSYDHLHHAHSVWSAIAHFRRAALSKRKKRKDVIHS